MVKRSLWFLVVPLAVLLAVMAAVPCEAGPAGAQDGVADGSVVADSDTLIFDENATAAELLDSAREMFMADNYALAEMLYKGVLVRDANNVDAMLELAIVYETIGKLEYARGLLTRASLLKPDDPEISRRNNEIVQKLGVSLEREIDELLAAGKADLAIPKLSVLLTTQPENAELYYKRAQCHLALGNPQSAIDDVDKALALRSDDRYFQLKSEAVSIVNAREIKRLVALARKQMAAGDARSLKAAVKTVGRILELEPENVWARGIWQQLTAADIDPKAATSAQLAEVWKKTREFREPVAVALNWAAGMLDGQVWTLTAILVVLLIFNSPLTRALLRGFTPQHLLSGRVERFSMSELLLLIHSHNATGVMRVRGKIKGDVYFSNGEITHCKASKLEGEDALQELLRCQEGSFVFCESSIPAKKTVHSPLSLILMELPTQPVTYPTYSMQSDQPRVQSSRFRTLLDSKE